MFLPLAQFWHGEWTRSTLSIFGIRFEGFDFVRGKNYTLLIDLGVAVNTVLSYRASCDDQLARD